MDGQHRRRSDISKPAKISDFLRIWGGIIYPLFTLFLAAGFFIVSPKQQFDEIHSDLHRLHQTDSVSIEDRRLINLKLDIVISLLCIKVITKYDAELSRISCPIDSQPTNSKVMPNVYKPSDSLTYLRNYIYSDLLHSPSTDSLSR